MVDFDAQGTSRYLDYTSPRYDQTITTATRLYKSDYFYTDLVYGKYVYDENFEINFQPNDVVERNYGVFLSQDNIDPLYEDYYQVSFHGGSSYEYFALYQINITGIADFNIGIGSEWTIQEGYGPNGLLHQAVFDVVLTDISVSNPVPEPTTMLLFSTGLAGLAGYRLRRKKKA